MKTLINNPFLSSLMLICVCVCVYFCRENVSVPVLANGNILSVEDIDDCLAKTSVVGVMTAEGKYTTAVFLYRL